VLVISEVSLALVPASSGAALLIRTFIALRKVTLASIPATSLTLEMSLTGDQFKKTAGVAQVAYDGRERVMPSRRRSLGLHLLFPLEGGYGCPSTSSAAPLMEISMERRRGLVERFPRLLLRLPHSILRGRDFTEQDTGSAPGVVLINETMKKKYWPKGDPVGQQLLIAKASAPSSQNPPARSSASSGTSATAASITIPGR